MKAQLGHFSEKEFTSASISILTASQISWKYWNLAKKSRKKLRLGCRLFKLKGDVAKHHNLSGL